MTHWPITSRTLLEDPETCLPGGAALVLPAMRRLRLRLRLTSPVRFHFHHGGAVHGLMCAALAHRLPAGLIPFAPESGQVAFEAGDSYHLGLTLAGEEACRLGDPLVAALAEIGRRPWNGRQGQCPTLGSNFVLEEVAELPSPAMRDLADEAALLARRLASRGQVRVRLLSPLRLRLPDCGGGFFDGGDFPSGDFPGGVFLRRLWQRWFFLVCGRYPEAAEIPPPPPDAGARTAGLEWLDLPVWGRRDARGRGRALTLGGVVGEISLFGLTPAWCALLAAGRHLHLGRNTRYGFGRFALPDLAGLEAEPFRPARTMLERAAAPTALRRALEQEVRANAEAGVDGLRPLDLLPRSADAPAAGEPPALSTLRRRLLEGRHDPQPLLGVMAIPPAGTRPPGGTVRAVPAALDRVAQRAAATVLGPGLHAWLENQGEATRRGLTLNGGGRALAHTFAQTFEAGFRHAFDCGAGPFYAAVSWSDLFARLEALLPGEPLVPLLRRWVEAPLVVRGQLVLRQRGLPEASPLAPALLKLALPEIAAGLDGPELRLVTWQRRYLLLCRDLERAARALPPAVRASLAAGRARRFRLERRGREVVLVPAAPAAPRPG